MSTLMDFNALYLESDDPWSYRDSWYETRKRAIVDACLLKPFYPVVFEAGCGPGFLSVLLASRAGQLLCCDVSTEAVNLTRQQLAGKRHVRVLQASLPDEWPRQTADLVVFSELGYYLTGDELDNCIGRMREYVSVTGEVLQCHWKHPVSDKAMSGIDVFERMDEGLHMTLQLYHEEPDFVLSIWSRQTDSLAALEQRQGVTT